MCVHAKSLQLCLTLWDPLDQSPLGTSVHGIPQARRLEWVAIPSPGNLPDPGIQPLLLCLLHLQAGSLPLVSSGKPKECANTKAWYKLEWSRVLQFNAFITVLSPANKSKENIYLHVKWVIHLLHIVESTKWLSKFLSLRVYNIFGENYYKHTYYFKITS